MTPDLNLLIAVPSKNRPSGVSFKTLAELDYLVFIEPQNVKQYEAHKCEILPENNKGIAYVRNFVLTYARTRGYKYVLMLDDDISSFYVKDDKKTVKIPPIRAISHLLNLTKFNKTIIGLQYQQFIWCAEKPFSENAFIGCVSLIDVAKFFEAGLVYDPQVQLKEDVDMCLQSIVKSSGTLRSNFFGFSAAKIGSNKGGLDNLYAVNEDEKSAKKMLVKWPGLVKPVTRPDGKFDIKISLK